MYRLRLVPIAQGLVAPTSRSQMVPAAPRSSAIAANSPARVSAWPNRSASKSRGSAELAPYIVETPHIFSS